MQNENQTEVITQANFQPPQKITMDVRIKIPVYTCDYHQSFEEAEKDGVNLFYNQALSQFFVKISHHDETHEWGVCNIELTGQEFFFHAK